MRFDVPCFRNVRTRIPSTVKRCLATCAPPDPGMVSFIMDHQNQSSSTNPVVGVGCAADTSHWPSEHVLRVDVDDQPHVALPSRVAQLFGDLRSGAA